MSPKQAKTPQERFDPDNRTYTTVTGKVLKVKSIGPGAVDLKVKQFRSLFREIKPPVLEVNHGKGRVSQQADYNDATYLATKKDQDGKINRMVIQWLMSMGVELEVPEEAAKDSVFEAILEMPEEEPEEGVEVKPVRFNTIERRYAYLNSIIDSQDYAFLLEVIVGAQGVTQLGLKQAAEDFPDNG